MFERLYDEVGQSKVNFVGYVSERARYDFAIIYTDHFFGKPLVVCMQTGKSSLLCQDDVHNLDYLQRAFHITDRSEAEELSIFLRQRVPSVEVNEQY
jgi:hypothetical protein